MKYIIDKKEKVIAEKYIEEAGTVAQKATCQRAKCGAVIVKDNEIIGRGFNSPPNNDDKERRCEIKKDEYDQKITDKTYLQQCALTSKGSVSARNLWQILLEQADSYIDKTHQVVLEKILSQGNLAERLVKAHHKMDGNKQSLPHIYRQLCECLQQNILFSL